VVGSGCGGWCGGCGGWRCITTPPSRWWVWWVLLWVVVVSGCVGQRRGHQGGCVLRRCRAVTALCACSCVHGICNLPRLCLVPHSADDSSTVMLPARVSAASHYPYCHPCVPRHCPAGVSQAWMLSSSLPSDISARARSNSWCGLSGPSGLTALDLGGSHFTHVVWVNHMCPLLAGMSSLQRLMLAHCNIPVGKMQQLLPGLCQQLVELNIDRWVWMEWAAESGWVC
jgi:hypothetical protein